MQINPYHPRWYGLVLAMNEYRTANFGAAVDEIVRANATDLFWTNMLLAAAYVYSRRLWLPIGLHFAFRGRETSGDIEIVGVARDIRHRVPEDRPVEAVYIPYTQASAESLGQMNLMVRTIGNPSAVVAAMRRELQSIDHNLPLVGVQTQAEENR